MRPGRAAALRVLVQTLRGDGRYGLGTRLAALPRLLRRSVRGSYSGWEPSRLLGVVLGGLYVLSPVDLVPELLLGVVGLADDAFVAAWLAGAVLAEVDSFLDFEKAEKQVVQGVVVD